MYSTMVPKQNVVIHNVSAGCFVGSFVGRIGDNKPMTFIGVITDDEDHREKYDFLAEEEPEETEVVDNHTPYHPSSGYWFTVDEAEILRDKLSAVINEVRNQKENKC